MTGTYSSSPVLLNIYGKGFFKLLCSTLLFCCLAQNGFGQTTILSDPTGMTYTNTDGTTGPDTYSINISNCTSVSFSLDYNFSLPWEGSGNMESADECPFGGIPCAGNPNCANCLSCDGCWDFLWATFNIDGTDVGGDLIGDAGTTDAEQSGTISSGFICTNGATNADITVVTQTWASSETVTFNNIMIVCYEAAPTIVTNAPFCTGSTLTLDGSATDQSAVVSWMWSNDGGGTITNPSAQNTSATGPTNGETYTLVTTDPTGCTGEASETVGVVAAPTASISASPTSACAGNPVTFTITGTANGVVTYNDGVSNQTVTLDGSGVANITTTAGGTNITYTLIDITLGSCNATLTDAATVTIAPPPSASISVAPANVCEGIPATFSFTGTPNATVTYFDGSTNQTVVLNGAGIATVVANTGTTDITYTLVNVSLAGCTAASSGSATVTVTQNPTATISVSPMTACSGELVTFTITGTPNADITYDDGTSNNIITLNGAGVATLTVPMGTSDITYSLLNANLNGCTQVLFSDATVIASPPPTASISVSPTNACEGDLVTFSFNGTPNATVTFFNGTFNQSLVLDATGFASTGLFAMTSNITYTLLNVTLGTCSQTINMDATVVVTPAPTALIAASPTAACEGDNIVFTFTGTPNATVTYNDGLGNQTIVLDGSGTASVTVAAGTTDLTYVLIDVSLNTCTQTLSDAATVNVTPAPSATIFASPTTACEGETVVFTISGTPNAVIQYFDGTSNQSILLDGSGNANITATTSNTDITYSLLDATLNNCIQPLNSSATVTITSAPMATVSASPTSVCEGEDVIFTFTGTPNATVTYNDGNTNQTIILDASGNASFVVTIGNTDLTYSLIDVTLGNCTQALSDVVIITISAAPTATVFATPTNACEGENIVFTFTGTPNATVTYNDGNIDQSITLDGSGNADVPLVTGNTNITFTLVSAALGNCVETLNGSATIIITPAPNATIAVAPAQVCEGEDVTFTFSGTPNATITYTDGNGNQIITLDGTGNGSLVITTASAPVNFSLVSATSNGCSAALSGNAMATIIDLPTASIAAAPTTACEGDVVTFTFSGTPNAIITYNNGTTNTTVTLDNSGNASVNATVASSDLTYTLVNATINNCTDALTESATVTVTPPLNALISVNPATACEGDNAIFTFLGPPNSTITYNNGTGDQTIAIGNSGSQSMSVTLGNTDYTITLVNVMLGNCMTALNNSATVAVTANPIASSSSMSACDDGTGQGTFDLTSINATIGTGTVTWLNAAFTPIVNPTAFVSGNATIYATLSNNGCDANPVPVVLTLDELPTFSNLTDDCTASNLDYVVVFDISGGTAPYVVTGGAGTLTGNQFVSDPIGIGTSYNFMITDANGCGPVTVSGVNLQCDCISEAGAMDGATLNPCVGETVTAIHDGNELLDGDDILLFVLHDNAGNTLGNIFATSTTPDFDLALITGLMPNTLYYISAVVGNDLGTGQVDEDDNCLAVSQGTPMVIQELPEGNIAAGGFICPDDCASVLVTLNGSAPFSVDYEINHPVNGIQTFNEVTNDAFFNIDVCADSASDAVIGITLLSINDNFCAGNFATAVSNIIVGNDLTTGQETYSGCEGDGYSVVVNGELYNEANPTGTEILNSYLGCDSIVSINLSFNDALAGTATYEGCTGDGYSITINGNTYDQDNPNGTETVASSIGCDSIITIALTFSDVLMGEENYTGCEGDGYSVTINGNIYNENNPTGTESLSTNSGCDSIVSINLVFNTALSGTESYDGCLGDGYSVIVNGETYDENNPTGTETLSSSLGCDSIVTITLTFSDVISGEELYTGCENDGYSVVVNGETYDESNPIGTETLMSSTGCDSIVTINLSYNSPVTGAATHDGCTGDGYSITLNGNTYNEANPTGTEIIPSSNGCDSIVTINLNFNDALMGTAAYSGCIGDGYSITINGNIYNEGNPNGTETVASSSGCDSIITIALTFDDVLMSEENYMGCDGDGYSIVVGTQLFDQSNPSGSSTLVSSTGCDSIVTVNLVFNDILFGTETYNGCEGDGYTISVNGTIYNQNNPTGTETLTSSLNCDSIVSINLVFNESYTLTENYNGCINDGYSITVNGNVYDETMTDGVENMLSTNGCDSIVIIDLNFSAVLNGTETYTGCAGDGYSVIVDGTIYNEANNSGVETLVSSSGCDSLVVIDLTYNSPTFGNETHDGCNGDGYNVLVNGNTYDESNPTGTEILTNSLGCDSIVSIDLAFNSSISGIETYNGCNGDGYEVIVNGNSYNESNPNGIETLTSTSGCDSIVSINLVFNTFLTGNETYAGCSGDGYEVIVNGIPYNESNPNGAETLTSSIGCDSIVSIDLNFNPELSGLETYDGCTGDGYAVLVNGNVYNQTNPNGSEILVGFTGCDSIVTIDLNFGNALMGMESYNGCENDGYTITVNGTSYNEGNPTGTEVLQSSTGCDSIVSINLAFNENLSGSELYNGCNGDGYSVVVNGNTYDESNQTGTEILTSSTGCDSIVSIALSFSGVLTGAETYTGCSGDGYAVTVNGVLYNESNPSGIETIGTATCDSIVSIDLVYNIATNGSFERAGCEGDGFEIEINGTIYNESNQTGIETLAGANYLGCDSIVSIALSFSDEVVFTPNLTLCQDDFVVLNGTIYDLNNPIGTELIPGGSYFGCDSVINVNLAFYPAVTASISADPFACPGDSTIITFTMDGGMSYNVVFDNGVTVLNLNNIADGHTITVAPTVTTDYSILSITDPSIPCTPTLQNNSITITVSNISLTTTIQSDFDGFSVSCNGSADGVVLAVAENGAVPYIYTWSDGTTAATANNLAAGVHTVTVTDAAGCTAEAQVILTEPTAIQVSGIATAPTCYGDPDGTIIIDTVFGGSPPYEYSLDGFNFNSINEFPYTIPFLESGLQEVFVQDVNDCVTIYNNTVPTPTLNYIELGDDQEITLGESYRIPTTANFEADTFFWSTVEWMDCDTCWRPEVTPQFTTTYEIQAIDEDGCSAFSEVTIQVLKPRDVYIPNAFSPNGDGENDWFTVYGGADVAQVNYLRIFDRWGELVFFNDDFDPNNEQLGWDGIFKGEAMQQGVYVYVAEVVFLDGEVLLFKGDLTVVK